MVANIVVKVITLFFLLICASPYGATANKKHYIVYMGHHSHTDTESVISANHDMLSSVVGSLDEAKLATSHHYSKSFRGFSAMLTPEQAQELSEKESVTSVFQSKLSELHTTHSWEFLGIDSVKQFGHVSMNYQSDVIVGLIDTGIWPESRSFDDVGLGPVPSKFKGRCSEGVNFTWHNCNRKIIGARFYYQGFIALNGPLEKYNGGQEPYVLSPRDADGHGTHTASTIAGSFVPKATVPGITVGTVRGGAPGARLAIYKACWFGICADADVLSAMDDAIYDGVDIISMSLGPKPPMPSYFQSVHSIGAFHAFQRGILVSASAGNSYFYETATNVAPWMLTVAASTIDRQFTSDLYLENSTVLKGSGINPSDMNGYYSLISGSAAAAPNVPSANASFCKENTLDSTLIKGKIVVCEVESIDDNVREKAAVVTSGGGIGIVVIDPNGKDVVYDFAIASVVITPTDSTELRNYMTNLKYPKATIKQTKETLYTNPAPAMATFSSKGPNIITPDIIKPDITAPGVGIVAAWSPLAITSGRSLDYNIVSGTSMACPHASAVAAIIKSAYPSWSPAAIKSAMMTTASVFDNTGRLIGENPDGAEANPFDYGSGHINITAALNPGLVYDYNSENVIDFLCSNGAHVSQISTLTGNLTSCDHSTLPSHDFNYPSIGVSNLNGSLSVQRVVTYYGDCSTVYYPELNYPLGVRVSVTPKTLSFTKHGEKKSFKVNLTPYLSSNGSYVAGALTWKNDVHQVRSPIVVKVISL